MNYKFNITLKQHINIKTQTGSAVNVYLIKLARGKDKCLNSFKLVVLLKESGSEF